MRKKRKQEKPQLAASHLAKVRVDVLSTPAVQLAAADLLRKAGNANDVGGLHVLGEEVTARLGHVLNLVPGRGAQRV